MKYMKLILAKLITECCTFYASIHTFQKREKVNEKLLRTVYIISFVNMVALLIMINASRLKTYLELKARK